MNLSFEDLTGTFSVLDGAISLALSFALSVLIAWVYRSTHRNVSYSQSYVQTLVILGMLISVIMLVAGSNIARAFALVGALSVIRFRNAIKETRDVGFIFHMYRFNWFQLNVQRQVVEVQVPADGDYTHVISDVLIRHAEEFELVSMESIRGGALTELMYTVRIKKGREPGDLISDLRQYNSGQGVTVLTGYDQTDL
ncbi:DUF4956 domain-containing protein [Amycolatopsis methanolica]|uniref:DUF4956 domain-containing protein n=1 Tax=Amycolatopsis methanolica TaxID=1814 RepID=UPI003413F44E